MQFLKAITTDGKTEYFNTDKILTISKLANGNIKILMGAGLYYNVLPESMQLINNILEDIKQ